MFRLSTRPLSLLSSKIVIKQLQLNPFNNFITYKQKVNINSNGLLFNNLFTFAELPKHKVLSVIKIYYLLYRCQHYLLQ
jgi:hypothetical protein